MKLPTNNYRWIPYAVFAACIMVLIALGYRKQVNNPLGSDLDVYLHGARMMLEEAEMYLIPNRGEKFYRYPPLLAFLISPLTRVSYEHAVLFWSVLNALLLCLIFLSWYYTVSGVRFWRASLTAQWVVGGFSLLVALRYVLSHFYYGQVNLLVLSFIVFGCILIARGRSIGGGVLIGLSLAIKPFALPFLVWFAVSGRLRIIFAVAAGVLAGLFAPATRVGVGLNHDYLMQWIGHMSENASPTNIWLTSNNVSLYASIRRLFTDMAVPHLDGTTGSVTLLSLPGGLVSAMAWMVFIALLAWVVFVARVYGSTNNVRLQAGVASFMFALVPALTTTAQKHYFVMLIPAIIYVLYVWPVSRNSDTVFRVLVVISFVLLGATGPALWSREWAQIYQSAGLVSVAAIILAAAIHRTYDDPLQHPPPSNQAPD